jgi:hypothetical protein
MSDEAKEEFINSLSEHMDEALARVCLKLASKTYETKLIRRDYVAQVAVLEFSNAQPTPDECDAIGRELRAEWEEMPDLVATLFRLSDKNAKLILDFNSPSGIRKIAEDGDISELIAEAQADAKPEEMQVPIISYDITKKPIQRADKMLRITPNAF